MATHASNPESGFKIVQNRTSTALLPVYKNKFFSTVPRLPVPRLPPKFRAPVPYYFWARRVYMSKIRSAVPKSCGHRAKILGCRAHFSAHVNGASLSWQTLKTVSGLKKLSDTKLKDKSAKYLRPVNCETLTTPRANPEIWDKLSHSVKQQDLRSSSTQKALATAGASLCKSMEMLLKMKNSTQLHSTQTFITKRPANPAE